MVASMLERAGVAAGAQPRRREHGRRRRLDAAAAARPRRRASTASSGCSRSTSSGSDRSCAELAPRAILLGNLFRDQLDRYGELETIADRWAEVVAAPAADRAAGAQRRRPAGRRSRARGAPDVDATSASRTTRSRLPELQHASDSKHCRRCGARLRLRGRLPRPPRPLPLPQLRPAAPRAGGRGRRRRARRHPQRRVHAAHAGREPRGRAPAPGLYNVYNALGAAALCSRSRPRWTTSSPGWHAVARRVRARRDDRTSATAELRSCCQEPRRRQRGAAHAHARGRRARPARRSSTTAPPTAATSRGSGTPTSRCSPRACAASPAPAPAPPSWRCG